MTYRRTPSALPLPLPSPVTIAVAACRAPSPAVRPPASPPCSPPLTILRCTVGAARCCHSCSPRPRRSRRSSRSPPSRSRFRAPASPAPPSTAAIRATAAPEIDGREDDAVWRQAQLIDSFRQFSPNEDRAPAFRTTAKVAYDDRYLYVFVRAYDPHPDSIVALLSRRDVHTQSEWLKVIVDSYHDQRTGYEFAVNPLGVKRDYFTYNDEVEDESWDGVWDAATRVDSAGWTAEFRIPFNQLRFAPRGDLTMGFGIWRDIARLNERDSWPVVPEVASRASRRSWARSPASTDSARHAISRSCRMW